MRKSLALLTICLFAAPLLGQNAELLKAVERHKKELKSRSADARAEAAESLGRLAMVEVVEPLIGALSDPDPKVRREAASALWSVSKVAKPAIPALRNTLKDTDVSVVMKAAGALIAMDEDESSMADELRGVLAKGDEVDRFLAARALIGIEPADKLAGPIVDYLRRNISSRNNFEMGSKALVRLAETNDRKAVPVLVSRLNENPQHLTEPILIALGKYKTKPDNWVPTLLGLLNSPVADVRETATEALGKQTSSADVKQWAIPVSRLVTDKEKNVRADAIRALSNAKGLALDAIGPVIQAVRSETDPDVREDAAAAVGEIADANFPVDTAVKAAAAKQALPVLTAAIESDANIDVRKNALRSVDRLQMDAAEAADIFARVAVEQKDRVLRLDAIQLLNLRGSEAASVASRIAPLKSDPDELIRQVTEAALESMKQPAFRSRKVSTAAAVDPGKRDKALDFLRERQYQFNEESFRSALNDIEPEVVEAFLDAGMSPNHKFEREYGNPAISVVLQSDEGCNLAVRPTPDDTKKTLKLLLSRGADANIVDDRKMTPLMVAVQKCDGDVMKLLLDNKANLNTVNQAGMSAFEFGLVFGTDGAAALATAGYRLSAEKVKIYEEAYAKDPQRLALVKKATKSAAAKTPATPAKKKS